MALMRSHGRLRDGKDYRPDYAAVCPNPCVPAGTLILTKEGYRRIEETVGEKVDVWNGEEWSEVEPRVTGQNQDLVKVTLSDETELVCTPAHRWCVIRGTGYDTRGYDKVAASDLQVGDRLAKFDMPVVTGGEEFPSAYTHGYYCGDGYDYKGHKLTFAYGVKKRLLPSLDTVWVSREYAGRTAARFEDTLPPKYEVPLWANLQGRLDWLAGLLDSDGTVVKNPNGVGLQISSVDKEFLLGVRLLLTTLGVSAKLGLMHEAGEKELPDGRGGKAVYWCQDSWRVLIGSVDAYRLRKLGLNCRRIQIPDTEPQRDAKRFVTVESVEPAGKADIVYCFTEKKAGRGTFNGIVTGQCAEQSLEDHECCDLFELFLPRLRDRKEFVTAGRLGYKVCKTVLQLKCSWAKSDAVVRRNQRMGIGVSGFCQSGFGADDYEEVYRAIEEADRKYSKRIKANTSIKLTTTKPSGTVSLLPGVTPGVHPAYSRYYIRRIRFSANDPIVNVCRANGYHVEPQYGFDGEADPSTQIVSFPVDVGVATQTASQVSAVDQLEKQKFLQTHWSDNNVSVTVYYRDDELPAIKQWLADNYEHGVKTVSFLRHSEHGFRQAPYEEITGSQYEEMASKCKPIASLSDAQQWDLVDSMECAGGVCPIK
jgi:ribonucleotide reductase alpha subunit